MPSIPRPQGPWPRPQGPWPGTVNAKTGICHRTATAAWTFWTNGPALAETGARQRSPASTPPIPGGATSPGFGAGTLTVDDSSLTDPDS
ncbi:hypothetical protein [Actinomadura sediminis]|uniref:Uncharacterized protein n=1 Tax=Actinomadura sediminis TaxID=1038904 RepID=A0ABW3EPF0_9ACTN